MSWARNLPEVGQMPERDGHSLTSTGVRANLLHVVRTILAWQSDVGVVPGRSEEPPAARRLHGYHVWSLVYRLHHRFTLDGHLPHPPTTWIGEGPLHFAADAGSTVEDAATIGIKNQHVADPQVQA